MSNQHTNMRAVQWWKRVPIEFFFIKNGQILHFLLSTPTAALPFLVHALNPQVKVPVGKLWQLFSVSYSVIVGSSPRCIAYRTSFVSVADANQKSDPVIIGQHTLVSPWRHQRVKGTPLFHLQEVNRSLQSGRDFQICPGWQIPSDSFCLHSNFGVCYKWNTCVVCVTLKIYHYGPLLFPPSKLWGIRWKPTRPNPKFCTALEMWTINCVKPFYIFHRAWASILCSFTFTTSTSFKCPKKNE